MAALLPARTEPGSSQGNLALIPSHHGSKAMALRTPSNPPFKYSPGMQNTPFGLASLNFSMAQRQANSMTLNCTERMLDIAGTRTACRDGAAIAEGCIHGAELPVPGVPGGQQGQPGPCPPHRARSRPRRRCPAAHAPRRRQVNTCADLLFWHTPIMSQPRAWVCFTCAIYAQHFFPGVEIHLYRSCSHHWILSKGKVATN